MRFLQVIFLCVTFFSCSTFLNHQDRNLAQLPSNRTLTPEVILYWPWDEKPPYDSHYLSQFRKIKRPKEYARYFKDNHGQQTIHHYLRSLELSHPRNFTQFLGFYSGNNAIFLSGKLKQIKHILDKSGLFIKKIDNKDVLQYEHVAGGAIMQFKFDFQKQGGQMWEGLNVFENITEGPIRSLLDEANIMIVLHNISNSSHVFHSPYDAKVWATVSLLRNLAMVLLRYNIPFVIPTSKEGEAYRESERIKETIVFNFKKS